MISLSVVSIYLINLEKNKPYKITEEQFINYYINVDTKEQLAAKQDLMYTIYNNNPTLAEKEIRYINGLTKLLNFE